MTSRQDPGQNISCLRLQTPDRNLRQLRWPSSTSSVPQREPSIAMAAVMVASREPAEQSWTKSSTGQETSAAPQSTGSMDWPGQERAQLRRRPRRGCSQIISSVPRSSAPETSTTGATSTSYSPPWPSNSHESTQNFDRYFFRLHGPIRESPTSRCATRWKS